MVFTTCSRSWGSAPKFLGLFFLLISVHLSGGQAIAQTENSLPSSKNLPNYFAQQFFMRPDQKSLFKTTEIEGLVFVQTPSRERNAQYSLVTDFEGAAVKSQFISGPADSKELRQWVKENLKKEKYNGVEIKHLEIPAPQGTSNAFYLVGHKAFHSAEEAQLQIEQTKSVIEAQGENFESVVRQAEQLFLPPPEEPAVAQTQAQFEKEEALILKYLDHLDVGNELFGPFQGAGSGEKVMWQSFAETTWRDTNLESGNYMQQLGYWTNRIVFKGIKAPLSTLDPYVEATVSLDSNGIDYKNNVIVVAGVEWRPFGRSAWLSNTRWWSLPLLQFIKSYRFYAQYEDRKNINGEITGSPNYDWKVGVGIFYEWGIESPPVSEGPPTTIPDYIRRYIWGEYFGNYYFTHTNFAAEDDFDAFIFNSSIILGIKLPGISLPQNPINDELVLMPYMRFEHVNNSEFSFPYDNRYFVAAGMRWMPFNNYRYKDNEWLAKTKVFFEYVGVGKVKHWKQDNRSANAVDYDFRVGVAISSKRV